MTTEVKSPEDEFPLLEFTNDIKLPHHSPSTLNSFIENKHSFINSKLMRLPFRPNPNMARGTAVESVVNEFFRHRMGISTANVNWEVPESITEFALMIYRAETEKYYEGWRPETEKEALVRESVSKMALFALEKYKTIFLGIPRMQTEFRVELPGCRLPIIGKIDYDIPDRVIRDCKVVATTQSKMPMSHVRQASVYRFATGIDQVIFDHFVCNKTPTHNPLRLTDELYEFGMSYITAAAKALEEIQFSTDSREVMRICMGFPDLDSLWNPRERAEAAEMWGIKLPKDL